MSFWQGFRTSLRDRAPNAAAGALLGTVGTATAGAVATGAGMAITKIHDALTKRRDFNQMLEYNPHLQEAHNTDPKRFNQMYSTLRTFNPHFSADPLVAGTYMTRMWENPATAGGVASDALMMRDKIPGYGDALHRAVLEGAGKGVSEGLKMHTPEEEVRRQSALAPGDLRAKKQEMEHADWLRRQGTEETVTEREALSGGGGSGGYSKTTATRRFR